MWNYKKKFLYVKLTNLLSFLRQANERRRYQVTPSLIGWAQN